MLSKVEIIDADSMGRRHKKVKKSGLNFSASLAGTLCLLLILGLMFSVRDSDALSILNTKHNLSATGSGPIRAVSETEVCVFCHTPHKASSAAPLWNRTMSSASYQLYSSSTFLSPTSPVIQPDKASKLCLSCHDGTVALGAVVNLGGSPSTISMQQSGVAITTLPLSSPAYLGTDLSGHHPVSIEMNTLLATDKQSQCNAGTVTFKICVPPLPPVKLMPTNNTYPPGGAGVRYGVQCTSCHDPHKDPNPPVSVFLRVGDSINTDQLCSSCHVDCFATCP